MPLEEEKANAQQQPKLFEIEEMQVDILVQNHILCLY